MESDKIYTIGFTKKSASKFFGLLKNSGAKRLVDVRLNNVSQLAGFAKKDDLKYFAEEICHISYVHVPELAPTQEILDEYKKDGGDWSTYERQFMELMSKRKIEDTVSKEVILNGCLLCSEDKPHHCHRRLVVEYLKSKWNEPIPVCHLV